MLFNTEIGVAFKNTCGQYEVKEFTMFELEKISLCFSTFKVKINKGKEVMFKVKCPLCGEYHHYHYNINEFVKRDMVIGGCELMGNPIFYIGKNKKVTAKINQYREINRQVYGMI